MDSNCRDAVRPVNSISSIGLKSHSIFIVVPILVMKATIIYLGDGNKSPHSTLTSSLTHSNQGGFCFELQEFPQHNPKSSLCLQGWLSVMQLLPSASPPSPAILILQILAKKISHPQRHFPACRLSLAPHCTLLSQDAVHFSCALITTVTAELIG